jgi:hypothetical protein
MHRILTIGLVVTVGLAMMVTVFLRQSRITTLKAERRQVLARLENPAEVSPTVAPSDPPDLNQNAHSPSLGLLKLRADVARLGNRKRELANARIENERLRVQLATPSTNVAAAVTLPAGYIRKSQARNLGYSTPEATFETMLWAIQNRDPASFLQAFDPQRAKQLAAEMQTPSSPEEFFKKSDALQGLHIVGREAGTDGKIILLVLTMPDEKVPARMPFKQFGDQWKFDTGL